MPKQILTTQHPPLKLNAASNQFTSGSRHTPNRVRSFKNALIKLQRYSHHIYYLLLSIAKNHLHSLILSETTKEMKTNIYVFAASIHYWILGKLDC